jgi:hypothetical protein
MIKVKTPIGMLTLPTVAQIKKQAKSKALSFYDAWIMPIVSVGLTLIQVNVTDANFVKKYKKILTSFVKVADLVRPYVEE